MGWSGVNGLVMTMCDVSDGSDGEDIAIREMVIWDMQKEVGVRGYCR